MSDIDDIAARCKANAAEIRADVGERARIEHKRWKPQPEPRVARSEAKEKPPGAAGWATRPETEAEWRR